MPRLAVAERYSEATTDTLARLARALALTVDELRGRRAEAPGAGEGQP